MQSYPFKALYICKGMKQPWQFSFLINTIRPYKRWMKWPKKIKDEDYTIVREWYGFSDKKTKEALSVLSITELNKIKEKLKVTET